MTYLTRKPIPMLLCCLSIWPNTNKHNKNILDFYFYYKTNRKLCPNKIIIYKLCVLYLWID